MISQKQTHKPKNKQFSFFLLLLYEREGGGVERKRDYKEWKGNPLEYYNNK